MERYYWNAITILQNKPTNSPLKFLVLKFGGFYTKMSFIRSIGYLISGSGLTILFETVYASTAVSHMLGGMAIARAVRGNYLVDTTLTTIILSNISKTEGCSEECVDENNNQTSDTTKVQIHDTCHTENVLQTFTDPLDSFF